MTSPEPESFDAPLSLFDLDEDFEESESLEAAAELFGFGSGLGAGLAVTVWTSTLKDESSFLSLALPSATTVAAWFWNSATWVFESAETATLSSPA